MSDFESSNLISTAYVTSKFESLVMTGASDGFNESYGSSRIWVSSGVSSRISFLGDSTKSIMIFSWLLRESLRYSSEKKRARFRLLSSDLSFY